MKKAIIFTVLVILSFGAFAQGEKFKATYLYQFARILKWPDLKDSFTIGVWNAPKVMPVLETIASTKTISSNKLVIKNITQLGDINNCQIIFLSSNSKGNLQAVIESVKGQNILIVAEGSEMVKKGAGVSFIDINGKILYEMSKSNIAKNGLISAQLLEKLAYKVY